MSEARAEGSTKKTTATKREVYYTPASALELVAPYIKDFKSIWDPAAGVDNYHPVKNFFEGRGHRVSTTDVSMDPSYDFLTYKTKKRYDIIVTTPPYSFRKEFLQRLCELKKPFAVLVPINVLESGTVRDLMKEYKISIVLPGKTVSFETQEGKAYKGSIPYSAWFLGGVPDVPDIVYL